MEKNWKIDNDSDSHDKEEYFFFNPYRDDKNKFELFDEKDKFGENSDGILRSENINKPHEFLNYNFYQPYQNKWYPNSNINEKYGNGLKNKKFSRNPFDYLNHALFFYYNQNPNFNPFIKIHAHPRKFLYNNINVSKQKYDPCSSFYYEVCDRIRECRRFPKIRKTNYWIKKNGETITNETMG